MDSMTAQTETVPGRADWPQLQLSTEDQLCSSYLVAHSDIFRKLVEVRAEVGKRTEQTK